MAFRLLCVGAHPDDESGAFGGALLLAHAKGIETQVLCLTDGGAASNRGVAESAEQLAQLRSKELLAANAILGVTQAEQLDYPDGKLRFTDFNDLVGAIVQRIRQWRPQVVVTFGPEGGSNRHRDHTVAGLATSAAFHWAGREQFFPESGTAPYEPQKLYYFCPPFLFGEQTGNIPRTPFSLMLDLGEAKQTKIDAFRAHRTQSPILDRIGDELAHRYFGIERYLLVASKEVQQRAESFFFDGVLED